MNMTTPQLVEYLRTLQADEQIGGWLMEVPDAFWQSPCSRSGQWHHGKCQRDHAISVARKAFVLGAQADLSPEELRTLYIAGLFHDAGKMIDGGAEHDYHGYLWMNARDTGAALLILGHMGKWKSRKASGIKLMTAREREAGELLQQADYLDAMEAWFE